MRKRQKTEPDAGRELAPVEAVAQPKEETGPFRTCIATRVVRPVEELLRFVVGPEGCVVPDLRRKLPGRGVWVTADAASVGEAVRRKAFQRGFKNASLRVPADLARTVDALMEQDALQALAMANKAGLAVTGSTKVEAAIISSRVAAVLHASEGSPDGIRKIDNLLRQRPGAGDMARINIFRADQLDLAFGRTNVIHAALAGGGACDAFLARCRRIAIYRSGVTVIAREGQQTHGTGATTVADGAAPAKRSTGKTLGRDNA